MTDSPDRRLHGNGPLGRGPDGWLRFLTEIGTDSEAEHTFSARNMVLDEGIVDVRDSSYRDAGCPVDHDSVGSWQQSHHRYLDQQLWVKFATLTGSALLDPGDPDATPETFRHLDTSSPFLRSGLEVELVRLETVRFVAERAGVGSSGELQAIAGRALGGDSDAIRQLDHWLEEWALRIDARPVYAGFWSEVADLFDEEDPGRDNPEWADLVRDRLGLLHRVPAAAGESLHVLLFRYPVQDVPRLAGESRERRPLVPPTVLDGELSEAFCPAPRGAVTGHVVHLRGNVDQAENGRPRLRCEVLHPRFAFRSQHLFRAGSIRGDIDRSILAEARSLHLDACRSLAGRPDYGLGSDGDLR